jgi:DNA invertase Pin-like site-specific DNA recombinase
MIAAYVRVSSRSQDTAMQRHSIERAAAARGEAIGTWYEEKRSGKSLARPELDRLRQDVRTGMVKRLYTFKLDRLTRSGVADTFRVVEELKAAGCELIAVEDNNLQLKPSTNDVVTDVFLFALGLGAKLERTAINERISAARERIEAEGGQWGRPQRLTVSDRNRILEMKAEGRSIREIAMAIRAPRATVARALKLTEGQHETCRNRLFETGGANEGDVVHEFERNESRACIPARKGTQTRC